MNKDWFPLRFVLVSEDDRMDDYDSQSFRDLGFNPSKVICEPASSDDNISFIVASSEVVYYQVARFHQHMARYLTSRRIRT